MIKCRMKSPLLVLAGFLCTCGLPCATQAAIIPLVNHSDIWHYHKGTNQPQSDWKTAPVDALHPADWTTGPGGFGFGTSTAETNNCRTILFDSAGTSATNYTTVYLRKSFTVTETPTENQRLFLRMDFDDGFIAWLDGIYLTNRNVTGAPAEPSFTAIASANHECSTGQSGSSPQPPETNDLGLAISRLPAGTHTLAIIGLNVSRTSTDFIQVADLFLETVSPPPGITNGFGGAIAVDTTWYATNAYYTVTNSVTVLSNATLTVEPGVTVRFRQGCGMTIQGCLIADGTASQPITFTRYPGDTTWERLMFVTAANSRLEHCVIEYCNCVGDHKDYYPTSCGSPPVFGPRNYHEAVVVIASHVDLNNCSFTNLPNAGATAEGDALAVIADDPNHPGLASANIIGCSFIRIGQGIHTRFASVLVEDCEFRDKHGDNDDVDLYGESDPPCTVRYNRFFSPSYDDRINPTRCSALIYGNTIYGSTDHGIVLRDLSAPVVFNNVLYNCSNGGISVQNGCEALIVNNTLVNCPNAIKMFDHLDRIAAPYCLSPTSGKATLANNIIWNSTPAFNLAGNAFGTLYAQVSHSDIQGGVNNVSLGANGVLDIGPGNFNLDPLFVAASLTNFHLTTGSPCIDTGTNLSHLDSDLQTLVSFDLDGTPRPLDGNGTGGTAFDIGAYEFLFASADSNGDGIPDGWCQQYGLDPLAPNLASEDPDQDFQNNWQEYLAGTDPTNPSSYKPFAAPFAINSQTRDGTIVWSNASPAGVVSILTATNILGPWQPHENYYTTNPVGQAQVSQVADTLFCRLLAVDLSTNTPGHYTNLLESYGILETVAGRGLSNVDVSQWQPSYEGEWATNVCLSRPHISFGDSRGNVLIVDQRSSSVLKVTPEGRLHTYAGTHIAGNNGDGPALATSLHLNNPNGGWLGTNDVLYVLDTDNAKVRRINPDGIMTTLVTAPFPMGDGRALWVKSDESLLYFGAGDTATHLYKWTPAGGVNLARNDFKELGNIVGDEQTGDLYISDRGANRIYRLSNDNTLTPIAGNGTQSGGGEGFPALQTGLIYPRSVCFLPNGGFFASEHSPGNRIWYIDPAGIIHRWMNGNDANNWRVGDGQWFYANPSAAKVSRVRAVNTDPFGNLIITESNYGYVRRIRFQRMNP